MRNAAAVRRRLVAGEASLVLTGHRHRPGVAHDGAITEVAAPALCVFPQAYLILVVDIALASIHLSGLPLREKWTP